MEREYCEGLRLIGRRPLNDEERLKLIAERGAYLRRALYAFVVFALAVTLFTIFALKFKIFVLNVLLEPGWPQSVICVSGMLLLMVALPLLIVIENDSLSRAGLIRRDLGSPEALTYTGAFDGFERRLEILSASRRVWSLQEGTAQIGLQEATPKWRIASPSVIVSDAPESAEISRQWLEPVSDKQEVQSGRRELSGSERDEIKRYANRLWRPPFLPALGLTIWLSIPITMLIVKRHLDQPIYYVQFVFLLIMTAVADCRLYQAVRTTRLLRRDARDGIVNIIENLPQMFCETEEESLPNAELEPGQVTLVEILPSSGLIWTKNRKPAMWRNFAP